jgi:hypothetical protein
MLIVDIHVIVKSSSLSQWSAENEACRIILGQREDTKQPYETSVRDRFTSLGLQTDDSAICGGDLGRNQGGGRRLLGG